MHLTKEKERHRRDKEKEREGRGKKNSGNISSLVALYESKLSHIMITNHLRKHTDRPAH